MNEKTEIATLAGGCFWCTEAIFRKLKGVKSIVTGYSGGTTENPSYEQVCSGKTGHAEAIQIGFNPEETPFSQILDVFWNTHDPTTINKQGNDIGTQYRSVIFYHNEEQRKTAEKLKKELDKKAAYKNPIVTEIVPFKKFYEAEDYHKNYFEKNKETSYCQFIIKPKIEKFTEKYKNKTV